MKRIYPLVLLLVFAAPSFCAGKPLAWDDVAAAAKASNPALVKAAAALKQAELSYRQTYSNYFPQLSASARAGESGGDDTASAKNYSYGLNGSLSLFSGFRDASTTALKRSQLEAARAQYRRTLSDTLYTLRRSFIDLLYAQESVQLAKSIAGRRAENLDLIRMKYEAGLVDKGSLMRVEADKASAEFDSARAERSLLTASYALVKAMGRDDFRVIAATGGFQAAPPGALPDLDPLVRSTPEYAIAAANTEASRQQVRSAKSSFYPSLSANGSVMRGGEQWRAGATTWSYGLSLSYPLFSGGSDALDVRIAELGRRSADESLRETRLSLFSSLASAFTAYIDAAGSLRVNEQYLNATAQQSLITSQKYDNGLATYLEWYSAENDYINACRSHLNARRDALYQEANWKKALGE